VDDGLLFADGQHVFQWNPRTGTVPVYAAEGNLGGLSVGPERSGNVRHAVVASERLDGRPSPSSATGAGPERFGLQPPMGTTHAS
jgi:hypothetical protein